MRLSYIFMDADYGRDRDREPISSFEPSLFVRATVMTRPTEGRAIACAGLERSSGFGISPGGLASVRRVPRYCLIAGEIEANPLIFAPQQAYKVSTIGDSIEILLIDDHDDGASILKNLKLFERGVAMRSFSADTLSREQYPEARFHRIQHPAEFCHSSKVGRT
jgi:hypothetical protein